MEILDSENSLSSSPIQAPSFKKLSFAGSGSDYFAVLIINWILTVITVGLYYPWARARTLSFIYGNTELEESRFVFHGTGKQMFVGFIKAIIVFFLLYGVYFWGKFTNQVSLILVGFGILLVGLLILVPVAVHGGLRYRLAKTSWRNIHFGYRGSKAELIKIFIPGIILTYITAGIYSSWMYTDLRKYIIGNIRFGNIKFNYKGKGDELFWINFKGFVLGILTVGIYLFWYMKNWINYYISNVDIEQNGNRYPVKLDIEISDYFIFQFVNFLLIVFTLGLATAWVKVRTLNFFFRKIEIPSEINFDILEQTENDFDDATGDDLLGMMDLGII